MKSNIVKELNSFLKGNFMAIHAYEKYIHHIKDVDIKQVLQKIQQNHKQHAGTIAKRIQDLGGVPVDDVGLMGNVAEWISQVKGPTKDSTSILKDALVGEHRGIEKSKELLNGDLDPQSLTIVKQVLDNDQEHVNLLESMIH